MKRIVNDVDLWELLSSHFQSLLDKEDKILRRQEGIKLHQSQGKAQLLEDLLQLRDKVNRGEIK